MLALALFAAFVIYGATAATHAAVRAAIDHGWIDPPPGLKWMVTNPLHDKRARPSD